MSRINSFNFFDGCKRKYNCIDKVIFYTKRRSTDSYNLLINEISTSFPKLKLFTKHYIVTTDIEDLPQFDLFEILIILPNNIVKDFYLKFQPSGLFLKNEEPINPLEEI